MKNFLIEFISSLSLIILIGSFSACQEKNSGSSFANKAILLVDDQGDSTILSKPAEKIICLSPALTEMAAAILEEKQKNRFAARSQVCNYPTWVKQLPEVNTFPLNVEEIYSKRPELIFSEVNFIDPQKIQKLRELGIPVYVMDNQTTVQILENIAIMGKLLGKEQRANKVVDSLKLELLSLKNQHLKRNARPKLRILVLISTEPIYIYGHNTLMEEKVRMAGGELALPIEFNKPYPKIDREFLFKMNPDVILGADFKTLDKIFFEKYPEMKKLKAYKNRDIYALNEDLASRPSPRFVASIREISNAIDSALKFNATAYNYLK